MASKLYSFILFSIIGQMLPVSLRAWAYDAKYNAWAHCPVLGDLAQASRRPGFEKAAWEAQRAIERDAIILSLSAFKAKYSPAQVA